MTTEDLQIADITPEMRNWSVTVMVTEKSLSKLGASDKPYQKLMLQDSQGTMVQATIFGSDIGILADTLHIYRTYSISNAVVQLVPPQHKFIDNQYQWILYARTPIEEIQTNGLNIRSLTYNFTPLSDLAEHIQPGEPVDVIFAILHVGQYRKVTESWATDVTVIDQGLKPTTLTLWDQFGSKEGAAMSRLVGIYPIVIGLRLKISHFNGIALATRGTSSFILNPPLPEANTLHNWCLANSASIKKMVNNKARRSGGSKLSPPSEEEIIQINGLPTTVTNMETYALKVTCRVTNFDQRLWYLCCSDCGRITDALAGKDFWCNYCKKKLPPKPRCKYDVELEDATGTIIATAFGDTAESLFGVSAEELYANTNEGELAAEYVDKLMNPIEYGIHIQATKYDTLGNSHCKFTIKAVHDLSTIKPAATEIALRLPKKMKKEHHSAEKASNMITTGAEPSPSAMGETSPKNLRSTKKKNE